MSHFTALNTATRLNVHSIETCSTYDGPGIRFVLFLQGCVMRCIYCHNPDTWSTERGRRMTVEEILKEIEPHVPIYLASGGGLTVSGGEPLLQASPVAELFRAVHERWGMHTSLDTSGYGSHQAMQTVIPHTDLFLYDLKTASAAQHLTLTGQPLAPVLRNAEAVVHAGSKIRFRHVLVPGLTDHPKDLIALGSLVSSLCHCDSGRPVPEAEMEWLSYHRMGKAKWDALGWYYPLKNVPEATPTCKAFADYWYKKGLLRTVQKIH